MRSQKGQGGELRPQERIYDPRMGRGIFCRDFYGAGSEGGSGRGLQQGRQITALQSRTRRTFVSHPIKMQDNSLTTTCEKHFIGS